MHPLALGYCAWGNAPPTMEKYYGTRIRNDHYLQQRRQTQLLAVGGGRISALGRERQQRKWRRSVSKCSPQQMTGWREISNLFSVVIINALIPIIPLDLLLNAATATPNWGKYGRHKIEELIPMDKTKKMLLQKGRRLRGEEEQPMGDTRIRR